MRLRGRHCMPAAQDLQRVQIQPQSRQCLAQPVVQRPRQALAGLLFLLHEGLGEHPQLLLVFQQGLCRRLLLRDVPVDPEERDHLAIRPRQALALGGKPAHLAIGPANGEFDGGIGVAAHGVPHPLAGSRKLRGIQGFPVDHLGGRGRRRVASVQPVGLCVPHRHPVAEHLPGADAHRAGGDRQTLLDAPARHLLVALLGSITQHPRQAIRRRTALQPRRGI